MSAITPAVKLEQRVSTNDKGNDSFSYRVIAAANTTQPRLGAELSENELDKLIVKHPGTRFNIVSA